MNYLKEPLDNKFVLTNIINDASLNLPKKT